jgi:transposase
MINQHYLVFLRKLYDMLLSFNSPIWFYPQPIDFRRQLDGLIILVADHLKMDPTSGQLFLFRSKKNNKIKMLWWDRNGFWLFYKRLEKGRFQFPLIVDQSLQLTRDQLGWLLSGLDCMQRSLLPDVQVKNFF